MALSFVKVPADIHLAKEPIVFRVETDSYKTFIGSESELYLLFTAGPSNGDTFTLEFLGRTEVFTFTTNAAEGLELNKIYINSALISGNFPRYIRDYVAQGLLKNYYFAQNYITIYAEGGGVWGVHIKARKIGPKYNMAYSETGANFSFSGYSPGFDDVLTPNFRIRCDVFAEDSYGGNTSTMVFSSDAIPDLSTSIVEFDIKNAIRSLVGYQVPTFSGDAFFLTTGPLRRYFVRFSEFSGSPATSGRYFQTPEFLDTEKYYTAINGAQAYLNIHNDGFSTKYLTPYPFRFLTAMPQESVVTKNQHQYLSCYLSEAANYILQVKLFFIDNTEFDWYDVGSFDIEDLASVITFRVGYEALNIEAITPEGKQTIAYQVRLVTPTIMGPPGNLLRVEAFKFVIDPNSYRNERSFLFFNSFGMPETLAFTGDLSTGSNFESTLVRKNTIPTPSDGIYRGYFEEVNNTQKLSYKLNSGQKTKEFMRYFLDFVNSRQRFLQSADKYTQVNIPKQKITLEDDSDTMFSVSFNFEDSWIEEGIA